MAGIGTWYVGAFAKVIITIPIHISLMNTCHPLASSHLYVRKSWVVRRSRGRLRIGGVALRGQGRSQGRRP